MARLYKTLIQRLCRKIKIERLYTVEGEAGVAHRTSNSYLNDPKVKKQLEIMSKY